MLPFHDEDIGPNDDLAGDAFMLSLFDNDHPSNAAAADPGAVSPSTPTRPPHSQPRSPFNPFLLHVPPATPPGNYRLPEPRCSPAPSPNAAASPTPASAVTPTPASAVTPTPATRKATVVVCSTTMAVEAQSSAAKNRYAQLLTSTPQARKARMAAALHVTEAAEGAAYDEQLDADLAEILALREVTTAESNARPMQDMSRAREVTAAGLLQLEGAEGKEAAKGKENEDAERTEPAKGHGNALTRLSALRREKAAREKATRLASTPPPQSNDSSLKAHSPNQSTADAVIEVVPPIGAPVPPPRPASIDLAPTPTSNDTQISTSNVEKEQEGDVTMAEEEEADATVKPPVRKLSASQRATAKRREKTAKKAQVDADKKARLEQQRVEKELAYTAAMVKRGTDHLITNPYSIPTKAASWVRPVIDYLAEGNLGGQWDACIKAYVGLLEDMSCVDMVSYICSRAYPSTDQEIQLQSASLSTKNRPPEIGAWINRARKLDKSPQVKTGYLAQWMLWWYTLQPAWRQGNGTLPPALYLCEVGEWGQLRNSGRNGIILVLLAAAWYGRAVGSSPEWVAAITDVRRVLEGMVEGGGKRAASSIDVLESNVSRKR